MRYEQLSEDTGKTINIISNGILFVVLICLTSITFLIVSGGCKITTINSDCQCNGLEWREVNTTTCTNSTHFEPIKYAYNINRYGNCLDRSTLLILYTLVFIGIVLTSYNLLLVACSIGLFLIGWVTFFGVMWVSSTVQCVK